MADKANPPLAFMSYSHRDDSHDRGNISNLCRELKAEVQAHTGEEFPIFQDRRDIRWGELWEERIRSSLDASTFFIPVVTPNFLASTECKAELQQFLERERRLGRKDLLLPLYYIGRDLGDIEIESGLDPLIDSIFSHQAIDWRHLRFSGVEERVVRECLSHLAEEIHSAIRRTRQTSLSRDTGEPFFEPHHLSQGCEQAPLPQFLRFLDPSPDPRSLLELALKKKADGDYEGAKEIHEQLMKSGVDWSLDIDLFVDHLYFAISLHDKLEDWKELDALERHVYTGAFSRVRAVVTIQAYETVRTMYQASMALSLLRQMRISEALDRIAEAVEHAPEQSSDAGAKILYANALVTRALILHASWSLVEQKNPILTKASSDLDAAAVLYRAVAKMEEPDEFHHLGRFYGTRAFLRLAERRSRNASLVSCKEALLEDSSRAHRGGNRTVYGRIAGQYCDAFCHFQIGLQEDEAARKRQYFESSLELLEKSTAALDENARLARVKVTGLSAWVAKQLFESSSSTGVQDLAAEHAEALLAFREQGHAFLDRIPLEEWLGTPLN